MKSTTIFKYIIAISLVLFAGISYAAPNNAVSKDNLKTLLKGNTIDGHHLKKDYKFVMYFKNDRTLVENRDGELKPGKWHINKKGKLCWSYDSRDKQWCRWIVDNDDGTYTKIKRKKKKVRKFKVISGNPNNL